MKATDRVRQPISVFASVLGAVLLWGVVALSQTPQPAAKELIADVVVHGNRNVPTQQIQGLLKTRVGAEYDPAVIQEDVRALYNTKQFGNVEVDIKREPDGKVVVNFLVREFPSRITKITYQGAKHLKDDDLNSLTGLRLGTPLNPIQNRIACQAIVRRYNDLGRPFASCELLKGATTGDTEVVFNISEGPIVKVRNISFEGNKFESQARLYTQINSSEMFIRLFGGQYNPAMADNDITKLEEYYKSFGYLDVRIARETHYSEDARFVDIVYHIQEGVRYNIKSDPKIEGLKYIPVEQLRQLVEVKAGDVYSEPKIKSDVEKIKQYIGYLGREAKTQPEVIYSKEEPGVVQVNYQVEEQLPARVSQIIIVGNERTKDNVILRQVDLQPGQILTYPDLANAERKLARLGIFDAGQDGSTKPSVTIVDQEYPSEWKDILVKVKEANTGSLIFGVGVNSDAGLQGSIVLTERNFDILRPPTSIEDLLSGNAWRGAGQEFRLEAVPGTTVQRYSASWREPFLFDSPYSLALAAYYNQRQFNEYLETREGVRATIGRRINQNWSVSGSVRVENVNVSEIEAGAPVDYTSVQGDNFLTGFKAAVTRDTRDSGLRPTSGSSLDISYEECVGDHTFGLANVDFNKYFTVFQRADGSGKHVLAIHSAVGWASDDTPVYERFFAGGFRSIRGFEFRGVGPDENGFKLGGDFMLLNSVEYQVPIKANDQIYAVAFVDSGTVESRVDIKDYRVSAGFGVRFVVPMLGPAPIALDFGFPIVKAAADNNQVFSFFLGFTR